MGLSMSHSCMVLVVAAVAIAALASLDVQEAHAQAQSPFIVSPVNGAIYHSNIPVKFEATSPGGVFWSLNDGAATFSEKVSTRDLDAGTYSVRVSYNDQGIRVATITFTVIDPPGDFSRTGPILIDWYTTQSACLDDILLAAERAGTVGHFYCSKYADNHYYDGAFHWKLAGLDCPEGTDRDCYGSGDAEYTYPITCSGTIVDGYATYTQIPVGFMTYVCEDADGHRDSLMREIKFKSGAKGSDGARGSQSDGAPGSYNGVLPRPPVPFAEILSAYNGTGWAPFNYTNPVIYADVPKFRGQSQGIESIHVTLNGTQVGGSNIKDDGTFSKGWKHAPLNQSGTYVLEIRERPGASVMWSSPIEIIVPVAPAVEQSVVMGAVEEEEEQPPPPPPPPPPPQLPQKPEPQSPPKSANVTLAYNGTAWVSFEDGMAITTSAPKFRGQTENLESVHVTLNGTQVGGSKVSDTGSFWKGWKHAPLAAGTYSLEVRESSDSAVLMSATVRITG